MRARAWMWIAALFPAEIRALDPTRALTQYSVEYRGSEHGLENSLVHAALQDGDGYLWVLTDSGLSRYDGDRFDGLDDFERGALENVRRIAVDRQGWVWAASPSGLDRLRGRSRVRVPVELEAVAEVRRLHVDRARTVWIASARGGLFRVRDGTTKKVSASLVDAIAEDARGTLYAGTRESLFRYDPSSETLVVSPELLGPIDAISARRDGGLWVVRTDALFLLEEGRVRAKYGFTAKYIVDVLEDSDRNLWIATRDDSTSVLYRLESGRLTRLSDKIGGFTIRQMNALSEDSEHNLWIAFTGGLLRLSDGAVTSFGVPEGLPSDIVWSITEDRRGRRWIGTARGLAMVEGDRMTVFRERDGLVSDPVYGLVEHPDGSLLAGGHTSGAVEVRDGRITRPAWLASLDGSTYGMMRDRRDRLWISTNRGLYRATENQLHLVLDDDLFRSTFEDRRGDIWLTTRPEIRVLRGGVGDRAEVLAGSELDTAPLFFIGGSHGEVWASYYLSGLARFEGGVRQMVTRTQGLPDNSIYSILIDDDGYFWLCTGKGIARVHERELNEVAAGKKAKLENIFLYTDEDGLRSTECNGRAQPSAWKMRDGKFWFATTGGVAIVDPRAQPEITAPKLAINSALVGRNLRVEYSALNFRHRKKINFRYRLEGRDEAWVYPGNRRETVYEQLSPGSHEFVLQASVGSGDWSSEEKTSFVIEPRPHQTNLFYAACGAAGLAIVLLFRNQRLRARQIELERKVKERTIELEHRAAELAEQAEKQRRFFANVSHELRTPLALILGPIETMREQPSRPAQAELDRIERNTRRLLELIDDMLDLSKLEAGVMLLRPVRVELGAFVEEIIDAFRAEADRRAITLSAGGDAAKINAELDEEKIERVLFNLLSNAIKYSPDGGRVSVAVAACFEHTVTITVSDEGPGIEAHELPHVFERFFQGSTRPYSATASGSGIGLALSRDIVLLHGGTITVESTRGRGATFTIRLPVQQTKAAAALNDHARPTVLIVDDEPDMLDYLSTCLADDYHVERAARAEEALELARRHKPDLVLSDVMMPGLDGHELCRRLRSDQAMKHLPVLLLTAWATPASKLEAWKLGADEYLSKPFSPRELRLRIENLLRRTQSIEDESRQRSAQKIAAALARVSSADRHPSFGAGDLIGGRYRILATLGEGGMGRVFEVEELKTSTRRALKISKLKGDLRAVARLAREALAGTVAIHPCVVSVFDVDVSEDGVLFFVMELVHGASLEAHRARFGDVAWALGVLAQIAEGLAAIHALGIVHRDLKPANVLLAAEPSSLEVKIADFGVAAMCTPPDQTASFGLTRSGELVGTSHYLAPEHARRFSDAGPASDIYSLGILSFELFAGRRPFEQPPLETYRTSNSWPVPRILSDFGPDISGLVSRCLSLEPDQRPTASSFAASVREILEKKTCERRG